MAVSKAAVVATEDLCLARPTLCRLPRASVKAMCCREMGGETRAWEVAVHWIPARQCRHRERMVAQRDRLLLCPINRDRRLVCLPPRAARSRCHLRAQQSLAWAVTAEEPGLAKAMDRVADCREREPAPRRMAQDQDRIPVRDRVFLPIRERAGLVAGPLAHQRCRESL